MDGIGRSLTLKGSSIYSLRERRLSRIMPISIEWQWPNSFSRRTSDANVEARPKKLGFRDQNPPGFEADCVHPADALAMPTLSERNERLKLPSLLDSRL